MTRRRFTGPATDFDGIGHKVALEQVRSHRAFTVERTFPQSPDTFPSLLVARVGLHGRIPGASGMPLGSDIPTKMSGFDSILSG